MRAGYSGGELTLGEAGGVGPHTRVLKFKQYICEKAWSFGKRREGGGGHFFFNESHKFMPFNK